jgi:glycosidase
MGVDGFRLDAIRHLIEDGEVMNDTPETRAWLQDYRRYLASVHPDAITVGEVWTSTEAVAEYVHEGGLDLAFEFDLGRALLDAAFTGTKDKLDYTLQNVSSAYPDYRFASILTNHDQDRVINEMRGDLGKARLAASLLLTAPGLPFLYYGEEIGQPGAKPDEMIRNPMPWTGGPHGGFTRGTKPWERLQKGFETRNVAAQDADPDSLLNHYRRLIRLRQAEPALARGSYAQAETGRDDLIAWTREHAGRRLLVLGNLGGTVITDWAPPAGLEPGRELTGSGSMTAVPARTVLVFELGG